MPAISLLVNEVFYLAAIFAQSAQIRRQLQVPCGSTGVFPRPPERAGVFFRKLRNFVQKLFEVSKSLLYSELRCFGICALPVGFVVEMGVCSARECC
jgi:hypothetical protein